MDQWNRLQPDALMGTKQESFGLYDRFNDTYPRDLGSLFKYYYPDLYDKRKKEMVMSMADAKRNPRDITQELLLSLQRAQQTRYNSMLDRMFNSRDIYTPETEASPLFYQRGLRRLM